MSRLIGIDLGTTMSVIATIDKADRPQIVKNAEGKTLTPSAVLIRGEERIVGDKAKRSAVARPNSVVQFIKRRMNEPDYEFIDSNSKRHRPEEISALILRKLKQDAEKALGEPVSQAVITVPAYFGDLERNRTKQAGEIAGLEVLDIINEPTAAAIAYGINSGGNNETILVYDLGGGTFDITVMQIVNQSNFQVLASAGNKYLGGVDFDEAICEYVADLFTAEHGVDPREDPRSYQDLRNMAEEVKHDLSSDTEAEIYYSASGHTIDVDLSRDKFEELIKPLIDQTIYLTKDALSEAKTTASQVDKVVLVGGSTRIPLVHKIVAELIGKEPEVGFNPDEVVALGAAAYAASLTGRMLRDESMQPLGHISVQDVTAYSLGISAYNRNSQLQNFIIIPRNSKIPVEIKSPDPFSTHFDNQTVVEIPILQGESADPDECTPVGDVAMLSNIPPQPRGVPRIEITLGYDKSGIVRLYAKELGSGREVKAEIEYGALMSASEQARAKQKVARLDVR